MENQEILTQLSQIVQNQGQTKYIEEVKNQPVKVEFGLPGIGGLIFIVVFGTASILIGGLVGIVKQDAKKGLLISIGLFLAAYLYSIVANYRGALRQKNELTV